LGEPLRDFAQLQLHFVDHIQWRYEVIRPFVLFADDRAAHRAEEPHLHPDTVRRLTRRFQQQGMRGLLPDHTALVPASRGRPVPAVVVAEVARLQALYSGFGYRELARIMHYTCNERMDDKTIKKLWQQSPVPAQGELPLRPSLSQADRAHTRDQVIQLYAPGWSKRSISGFLRFSRPTVARWIGRLEAEHMAGLEDKSRAPKAPARKAWLPLMIDGYHLQKRHPDAGRFRMWSLLARPDISERPVGRVMALNKQVYDDIPQVDKPTPHKAPGPHPYKATAPHGYWFIDGRKMDFAIDGVKWWSLIILDGYSRTMLAGAGAPTEASWVALMVLDTACLRYGSPKTIISDSGGAYISEAFEAVCDRLEIHHEPIVSTHGESYKNLLETHCNVQRRLYDYQFSLTQTPAEFEQVHQAFLHTSNTTAHQGLLQEAFDPPIPLLVLGEAKGRLYPPDELTHKFSHALFPRTTNQYGCVTLYSYHFYIEEGLPKTRVLLWVYGEQLRAVLDNVVLAEYHCRYEWRPQKVTGIRDGVWYATRVASPQTSLLPVNAQETLVLYRPRAVPQQTRLPVSAQQLWLFELVRTG